MKDDLLYKRFVSIVTEAFNRLSTIDETDVAVAASPARFNDIFWSNWRAVRCGSFVAESHEYGPAYGVADLSKALKAATTSVRTAAKVLEALEAGKWREVFAGAYGVSWEDHILALVVQDGQRWLVFSSSNACDENHTFKFCAEDGLQYFGECQERYDWGLIERKPLRLRSAADDNP